MIARGLLKVWVLKLLSGGERTGYQLIKELERRIGWQPSPGSIYPLLQMLGEAGLLRARPAGNKVYWSLTPEGERYLEELRKKRQEWLRELGIKEQAVWQIFDDPHHPLRVFPRLAHLVRKAFSRGRAPQALAILEEAAEKLSRLIEGEDERGH
ncbi:MAG: PadR family transcriptional regulator [Caldiserica bacterium]|nr:PadR family transcriptional regulator [Caldisericota bacterium]